MEEEGPKKDLEGEIKTLQTTIDGHSATIESLKSRHMAQLQATLDDLHAKVMAAGGVRLTAQQSKVDLALERRATLLKRRDHELPLAVTRLDKDANKHTATVQRTLSDVTIVRQELEGLDEEVTLKTRAAMDVKLRCDEAKSLMEDKQEQLEKVKRVIDEKREIINTFRTKEVCIHPLRITGPNVTMVFMLKVKIKAALEDDVRVLEEGQKSIRHFKQKQASLSLQAIE